MDLDARARAAGSSALQIGRSAVRPDLRQLTRRRRKGQIAVGAVGAAFAIVLVGVILSLPTAAGPTEGNLAEGDLGIVDQPATSPPATTALSTTTTMPTTTTTAVLPASDGVPWSITHPAGWHRADSDLMPALGWDSITLSNAPIPTGGERCAQVPEAALRQLGPEDAIVTIFFSGVAGTPWPEEGFSDSVFPQSGPTDAHDCAERPELEIHWDAWSIGATGVYVAVAFGAEVDAELRAETWGVLSSLEAGTHGNTCVVTAAPDPDWEVPDPYQQTPTQAPDAQLVWYGSPELWAPVPQHRVWSPRKSVWWSADFAAGDTTVEVEYKRIDVDPPTIINQRGSGLSWTQEDGSFVIAGLDPDTPGCWRVTASHGDTQLSYVFWLPND